jgi:hypothetical protein
VVSLVVERGEPTVDAYREAFGWGPWRTATFDDPGDLQPPRARIATAAVGDVRFEVVEPFEGGPWRAILERNGPGLAAIGLGDALAEEAARTALVGLEAPIVAAIAGGSNGEGRAWTLHDVRRDFGCLIGIGTPAPFA